MQKAEVVGLSLVGKCISKTKLTEVTVLLDHSFHRLTKRWVGRRMRENKVANRSDTEPGEGCELWDERRRHF